MTSNSNTGIGSGNEGVAAHEHDLDADYAAFLRTVHDKAKAVMAEDSQARVFTTQGSKDLFQVFLDALPYDQQAHTCNTCRHFFNQFGSLVTIDAEGQRRSLMWNAKAVPEFYSAAVTKLQNHVERAKVDGLFFTDADVLGTSFDGKWSHISIVAPKSSVNYSKLETAGQLRSKSAHEHKTVITALKSYGELYIMDAIAILSNGSMKNSEVALNQARWFLDLKTAYTAKNQAAVWRAISLAPKGFLNIRSGVLGSLLDDIQANMKFSAVKARFEAKTASDVYQRPKRAPSVGNLAVAEKTVAALGVERSMPRRYATLDEITTFWVPRSAQAVNEAKAKADSVFGHLMPSTGTRKGELSVLAARSGTGYSTQSMTFSKFQTKVLPTAVSMAIYIEARVGQSFAAITTQVNADAPPILQWDNEGDRNPYSWYMYTKGSSPVDWNLSGVTWAPVTALALLPAWWKTDFVPNMKAGIMFILEGCKDKDYTSAGLGLFPQILKNEFHGIRRTIEAYSTAGTLDGAEEASACGLVLSEDKEYKYCVRVTDVSGVTTVYNIDRLD